MRVTFPFRAIHSRQNSFRFLWSVELDVYSAILRSQCCFTNDHEPQCNCRRTALETLHLELNPWRLTAVIWWSCVN